MSNCYEALINTKHGKNYENLCSMILLLTIVEPHSVEVQTWKWSKIKLSINEVKIKFAKHGENSELLKHVKQREASCRETSRSNMASVI